MRRIIVIFLVLVLALASGCASFGRQSSQYGVRANTNGHVGSLQGSATSRYLLWGFFRWGDSGVARAAKNSGGQYIRTVDQSEFCFLGIYGSHTTIVTTENTPATLDK